MTEATIKALDGLRDFSTLKWYVIPLLAIVFYIYSKEISLARKTSNWNAVFCGLTILGLDFFNETWNGWVMVLSGRSAFWTAPGDTAFCTMVGWNIEIMFMFAILGIIYYYSLSESKNKKILGIDEKWLTAIGYSAFCVLVEVVLNSAGMLVWEYPFWTASFAGVWLIFLIGYFHFFVGAIIMLNLKKLKSKLIMLGIIYAVPIIMNIIGMGILGWKY
jgi:hypothetical protein